MQHVPSSPLPRRLFAGPVAALLLASTLGIAGAPSAVRGGGDAIDVTTTDDELNADGDCSLREAIQAANTNAQVDACPAGQPQTNLYVDADVISVPAGTYQLSIDGAAEDDGITGDLDITEAVRILGAGDSVVIGTGTDRVFDVMGDLNTEFSDLTIRGGDAGVEQGGGVRLGDSSCLPGGNIQSSTVLRQVVVEGNAAAQGGGVHVGDCVYLLLSRSSVADNTATVGGGASVVLGGQLTASHSTLSGNLAEVAGGGVAADVDGAVAGVSFDYATIAANRAPDGAAVWVVDEEGWGATYSVIADNDGPACVGSSELVLSVTDDASCGDGTTAVQDARLGAATRIGRMIVHVPGDESPAIDVSDEFSCGFPYDPADQVGSTRPQDGDGDGTPKCDAGAIEVAAATAPTLPDTAMAAP